MRITFPIGSAASVQAGENQAAILQRGLSFSTSLTQGPFRLQNFTDKSVDYLVQDAENVLHLIHEEQVVFSYQIEGQLVSPVYQIDYYQNGKLQMLFATAEAVHVLDRLGNTVEAFPLTLPGQGKITHLSLVDYDRNKNYRYFLGTSSGELFLMDKRGTLLEGWDPISLSAPLAAAPQHHRIPGLGDRMVALTQDGQVYIFNRRGEPQAGSPVSVNAVLGTDYGLVLRGQASDSRLTTVSEGGEVLQVNFKGEVAYRNQLAKPDAEVNFQLLPDNLGDRFLFLVQSFGRITVMDQEQAPLFEIPSYSEDVDFKFYNFGKEASILVLLDKTQEFVYIYNLRGEMMHTLPLAGSTWQSQ
ncbi:hypothetical protein A3SI_11879 [Nitritalea halalkaliphila LW7]|uniref:Uncharacterized protein n=2 Tax=Nitritalea TaxID=1187887 RepID=I5C2K3_9BACT|nr:hypothetical protein A3SI_11879 [Nitritalea halalkaliphila LW7]